MLRCGAVRTFSSLVVVGGRVLPRDVGGVFSAAGNVDKSRFPIRGSLLWAFAGWCCV